MALDQDIAVSDLSSKGYANILSGDYLMGVATAEAYKATITNIATRMALDIFDGRYVSLTGSTMTGSLTINPATTAPQVYIKTSLGNSAVGQTIPDTGDANFGGMQFNDNQGYNTGWFRQYKNSNDRTYSQMTIRRHIGNSDMVNSLTLGINADGTRFVGVSEAAPWRTALNVVNKSGDMMTGGLVHESAVSYYDNSNTTRGAFPSSSTYGNARINFRDSADDSVAQIRVSSASAYQALELSAFKDSNTANVLRLGYDSSGNPYAYVTSASAWRSALDLAADSAWGTNKAAAYRKQGSVVTVTYSGTATDVQIPTSAWTTIATLPSGYRPNRNIYGAVNMGVDKPCALRITSAGLVQVYATTATGAIASGAGAYFNVSFII